MPLRSNFGLELALGNNPWANGKSYDTSWDDPNCMNRRIHPFGSREERDRLERLVGGRYWGPGRFRRALREAAEDGNVRRPRRDTYEAPEDEPERPPEPVGAGSSRS